MNFKTFLFLFVILTGISRIGNCDSGQDLYQPTKQEWLISYLQGKTLGYWRDASCEYLVEPEPEYSAQKVDRNNILISDHGCQKIDKATKERYLNALIGDARDLAKAKGWTWVKINGKLVLH